MFFVLSQSALVHYSCVAMHGSTDDLAHISGIAMTNLFVFVVMEFVNTGRDGVALS